MKTKPAVLAIVIRRFGDESISEVTYQMFTEEGVPIAGPGLMPSEWMESFSPIEAKKLIAGAEKDIRRALLGEESEKEQAEGLQGLLPGLGLGEQPPR